MGKPTFLEPLIGKRAGQAELVNAESGTVLTGYVEAAFDGRTRKRGLLGRDAIPADYALVLAPCSAVHTFFMRFPIDLLFVSRDGTVTKAIKSVRPWRIAGSLSAYAVIEAGAGFIERHELVPGEKIGVREIPLKRRATDALPSVAATEEPPVDAAGWHSVHKRLTLAELQAERMPLEWHESVAIVQELCEAVLTRGPADDLRVPELKHIALTSDGRVMLQAAGPPRHSPVNRAGLVLLALTPEDQLPVQLRLLVLEEVSPRPRLAGLTEFHRELEIFERPDRAAIVRGVYERFRLETARRQTVPVAPAPLLEPPRPGGREAWWRRRGLRVGTAVVLVAALTAGAAWAWRHPRGQWLRDGVRRVSTVASSTSTAVAGRVRREINSARWAIGSRPRATTPSVPVLAEPPANVPGPPTSVQRGEIPVPPALPGAVSMLPRASFPSGETRPQVEPLGAPAAEAGASRVVYSAADAPQVVPPTLLTPRRGTDPAAGRSGESRAEVELLVSTAGEVESVKLVSGQTTTLSGMQVSAIKAWRFQPATREGLPVRYRLRMPLPTR